MSGPSVAVVDLRGIVGRVDRVVWVPVAIYASLLALEATAAGRIALGTADSLTAIAPYLLLRNSTGCDPCLSIWRPAAHCEGACFGPQGMFEEKWIEGPTNQDAAPGCVARASASSPILFPRKYDARAAYRIPASLWNETSRTQEPKGENNDQD
jgi:hypothetical protein